jgi:hypothetical protein
MIAKDELHRGPRKGQSFKQFSRTFQGQFKLLSKSRGRGCSIFAFVRTNSSAGNSAMNAQRPTPHYVEGLSDLARHQATVAARCSQGGRPDLNFKPSIGITIGAGAVLGLGLCAVIATALGSASPDRVGTITAGQSRAIGANIERNAAALMRARVWWEGYGQRHPRTNALAAK